MTSARRSLALVWRSLRSMRTALILLLLLAVGAIAGSLVPQQGVSDARIAQIVAGHPLRARIYQNIGLFDVYGSWWFTLIYVLLLISLAACLLPRTRAFVRNLFSKPQPAREIDSMRHYAELAVPAPPATAIEHARKVLRRRFFRINQTNGASPSIAADKGTAREGGSLLFHWSFFLILVGVAFGKGTGFTGTAIIAEGQTWTEAHANYDGQVHEGSFFGGAHTGVQVHVEDFTVKYRPSGLPLSFDTRAQLINPDGTVARTVDITVNHPAEIDGVRFYQFDYGWAPDIVVSSNGVPVYSGPVEFVRTPPPVPGVDQRSLPWQGVVKLPSTEPQLAIRFELWPDLRALVAFQRTGKSFPMLQAYHPVLTFTVFKGDLGPSEELPANQLNSAGLQPLYKGAVGEGRTKKLPGGLSVGFPSLGQYTVLHVARDRGVPIMLLAAVLILLGLIPALYSSKRRVWVRAEASGEGTVLKVGGFALQRTMQFEEEFSRLVERMSAGKN